MEKGESIQELVGWVGDGSNVILDPTLALVRAQFGFKSKFEPSVAKMELPWPLEAPPKSASSLCSKGPYGWSKGQQVSDRVNS